jgi:tetratricopeptide (TPR) repeat protein
MVLGMKQRIAQMPKAFVRLHSTCVAVAFILIVAGAVGCGPADPIESARQLMATGDVEGGLDLLREALDEDKENPELLFLYGRALIRSGQPGLAEWPLRKAMQDPTWFETAAKALAGVEQSGGNYENAAQIYAEILAKNPEDLEVRILRANACAQTPALFEEALAEVDRIREIAPEDLSAFKPRILALLGLNRVEEADEELEALGARLAENEDEDEDKPILGWHCATEAIFASEKGEIDLAAERWAECEARFPANPNVVVQSIEFHRKQGDLQRALEVAEAAYAEEPSSSSGYRLLVAQLLREVGRTDEAEELLVEGVEESTELLAKASAMLALTEHYKLVGNVDGAVETLEKVLALTQSGIGPQPDLLFSLAELLIQQGEYDRAIEISNQMTVAAHRSLVRARVAHERKEYEKALQLYSETTRLWPQNPYAPYHEARAAMSAGLFDRAFQSYLLSIRVDETATDARIQAARLMKAQGRLQSALELLASTRASQPPESDLLGIEISTQMRGPAVGINSANHMSQRRPDLFGMAIAAAARGASERSDPRDAWSVVEPVLGLNFASPQNQFPILEAALVVAPGEPELARIQPVVEKVIAAYPDSAVARELEGLYLERTGDKKQAAMRYRAALEAESKLPRAMLRLARVTAGAGDEEEAAEWMEKALAIEAESNAPFDTRLFLSAVDELPASPRRVALLERALEIAPASGGIALRLAEELDAEGGDTRRIARLANRAVRFQAGEEAVALWNRLNPQG